MSIESHNMTKAEKALDILSNIGASDFKLQRQAVLDAIGDKDDDRLLGLENLLDAIANFCHDELGMDTIIKDTDSIDYRGGAQLIHYLHLSEIAKWPEDEP